MNSEYKCARSPCYRQVSDVWRCSEWIFKKHYWKQVITIRNWDAVPCCPQNLQHLQEKPLLTPSYTPSFSDFSTLYSEHCQSPLTRLLLPDSPANPSPGWRCRYPLLHCWNTMSTDLKVFHESELHSTIKLHNKTFPAVVLKLSHLQLVIKQRVKGQELDFPPLHVLCS